MLSGSIDSTFVECWCIFSHESVCSDCNRPFTDIAIPVPVLDIWNGITQSSPVPKDVFDMINDLNQSKYKKKRCVILCSILWHSDEALCNKMKCKGVTFENCVYIPRTCVRIVCLGFCISANQKAAFIWHEFWYFWSSCSTWFVGSDHLGDNMILTLKVVWDYGIILHRFNQLVPVQKKWSGI